MQPNPAPLGIVARNASNTDAAAEPRQTPPGGKRDLADPYRVIRPPSVTDPIIYWQAREISRLAADLDFPFDSDLIRHISPIEWKNVVLYSEIRIDPNKLWVRNP